MNQRNKHSESCRRMIDSGVEWIGQVPEGWAIKKLKEVARRCPRPQLVSKNDDHHVGGVPVITPGELSGPSDTGCSPLTTRVLATEVAPAGSVAVANIASIGKIRHLEEDSACNPQVVAYRTGVHQRFFYYSMFGVMAEARCLANTTTIPFINTTDLGNIPMALPPLPEQRAIAAYLDHHVSLIDQERDLIAQKIDLLKDKRRAMIYEAVTGKRVLVEREALAGRDDWSDVIGSGPVVAIPAPRADDPFVRKGRLVDSGVEWIGDIPEGWDVKKVKELTNNIQSGRTPVDMESVINADGIPWITISDMSSGKISAQESVRVDPGSAGPEAKIGDVLYSIYATIGVAAGPVDMPLATNQAILSLRPVGNGVYLKYCLDAIRPFVLEAALSNTQANLSAGSVRNLLLPAPTLAEQQTIVSFLNHNTYLIDQKIDLLAQKRDLLGEQRKALIFEAVTGKLDVSA